MIQIILELVGLFMWAFIAPALFFSYWSKRWMYLALLALYIFCTEVMFYFTLLNDVN